MRKLLLSAVLLWSFAASSQTQIYLEDFEPGSTWTLNTILGAEGTYPNAWYISCQEDGQTAGQCGTACSINDNSLHVGPNAILGDLGAAYFEGLACNTNRRAESGDISTVGATNLNLNFDMIGAGNAQDFTELFYSIDGGASWISLATPLTSMCCGGVACTGNLQGLWQNNSYSLPASCENISNLRLAFVWQNLDDGSATDPSFAVDDIEITGTTGGGGSWDITTSQVAQSSWCYGTTISDVLDFTSNGTFNAPNVYTAEMSDAAGSFAAPTSIGTLASSASGALTINIAIPGSMPAGTGYRVRVVASDPATVGTDNGSDITIYDVPTVNIGTYSDVCVYTPFFTLTGGTPSGGTYSGPGVAAGAFDPAAAGVGTHTITYSYTDGNNCSGSATETITVDGCIGVQELDATSIGIYPNPADHAFTLVSKTEIDAVHIVDMNGRTVKSFAGQQTSYAIAEIHPGVYFVHVEHNNVRAIKRLVIR